jgi:hypothetical protein
MKFQLEYLARHTWSFFQFHDGALQNPCSIAQSLYTSQIHGNGHVGLVSVF